jgi:hypothetical protein
MSKTNFDRYLEKQLADPVFAARLKKAGEAWPDFADSRGSKVINS